MFSLLPVTSCGFVSHILLENTERQMCEEEGNSGSGKVRGATK